MVNVPSRDCVSRLYVHTPTIRNAEVGDAQVVAAIYVESWSRGFWGLLPSQSLTDELASRWKRDLAAPYPRLWWVAEIDGNVVGFASIGPSRDPIDAELGELDTIAVRPSHWLTGVGRALMSAAVAQLTADGYHAAVAWTLRDYERGQAFYESTGWRLDGGVRDGGRQIRYRRPLQQPG